MKKSSFQKSRRFLSGAGVLLVGSVVAKMLGALYRIPLTNILGAEGMGMYQLVFPVYALFMVLATAGIPTALSRLVAEKRALGEDAKKYLIAAMFTLVMLGIVFASIMTGSAKFLARKQGNADTYSGFLIVSPAIGCVCVIAGLRGWFQGQSYMLPTALSNIVEQVVKLSVGIGLSFALAKYGVIYAVCGAFFGVLASEVLTLVYMCATYFVRSKKERVLTEKIKIEQETGDLPLCDGTQSGQKKEKIKISKDDLQGMLKVALPIAVVSALMPLSNFFDSVIIVNMLKSFGLDKTVATAQYGILSGPVNSLVNMPVVAIISLAVAIVPSVSASRVVRDAGGVMLKSSLSVRLAYLLGIPCAFFLAVFSKNIIGLIYPNLSEQNAAICINTLRISAANVVFLSVMQIYVSLLQALDKTKYAILSFVFAICVKIVLDVTLTRFIGINGAAIASLAFNATAYVCSGLFYFKICGLHLEKNVGLNLLSGVIMALCGIGVGAFVKNDVAAIVVGFVVCVAVYVWLAFLFNLVTKDDIPHLPLKKLLWALHRTIRFWEYKDETR